MNLNIYDFPAELNMDLSGIEFPLAYISLLTLLITACTVLIRENKTTAILGVLFGFANLTLTFFMWVVLDVFFDGSNEVNYKAYHTMAKPGLGFYLNVLMSASLLIVLFNHAVKTLKLTREIMIPEEVLDQPLETSLK
ncbi:MAG: hypothetical protein JKY09_00900 [Crocinitomicaceae bacterium]|nr:hypothetical protein [Crocinitomicaceae bacterium]